MNRVRPGHGRPGHYRCMSLPSEHHVPTLRAPRPRLPGQLGKVSVAGLRDDDEGLQALAEAHAAPVVSEIAEAGPGEGAAAGCSADAPSQDPRANETGVVIEPRPTPEVGPSTRCRGAPQAAAAKPVHMASAHWEKEQQWAAPQALEQRESGWQARKYRVAIAAMGHLEARFVEQLHALWFEPQPWIFLPPKLLTIFFRALSFNVTSKAHCAMH